MCACTWRSLTRRGARLCFSGGNGEVLLALDKDNGQQSIKLVSRTSELQIKLCSRSDLCARSRLSALRPALRPRNVALYCMGVFVRPNHLEVLQSLDFLYRCLKACSLSSELMQFRVQDTAAADERRLLAVMRVSRCNHAARNSSAAKGRSDAAMRRGAALMLQGAFEPSKTGWAPARELPSAALCSAMFHVLCAASETAPEPVYWLPCRGRKAQLQRVSGSQCACDPSRCRSSRSGSFPDGAAPGIGDGTRQRGRPQQGRRPPRRQEVRGILSALGWAALCCDDGLGWCWVG